MTKKFKIKCPIGINDLEIYYDDTRDDRIELLKKVILSSWKDYCNKNWLWHGKPNKNKLNNEDKVKKFLNRCADFLLHNRYGNTNIITPYMNKRIINTELSLDGDWQNENIEKEVEETIDFLNRSIKKNFSSDSKILENKFTNKPFISNKKHKSKLNKINEIYSQEEREIEDYEKNIISNNFHTWNKVTKIIPKRDGVIDKARPYISEWCIVDTENIFTFQSEEYRISEDVKQYNIRLKMPRFDDYRNDYKMDKILVFKQDNKLYFYDQNINIINKDNILKLTSKSI